MLGDEGRAELAQLRSQLRNNLRTHEIFHGLLGAGVGVIGDLELWRQTAEWWFKPVSTCVREKGTYDVLIFLGVVGYFGYRNRSVDLDSFRCGA